MDAAFGEFEGHDAVWYRMVSMLRWWIGLGKEGGGYGPVDLNCGVKLLPVMPCRGSCTIYPRNIYIYIYTTYLYVDSEVMVGARAEVQRWIQTAPPLYAVRKAEILYAVLRYIFFVLGRTGALQPACTYLNLHTRGHMCGRQKKAREQHHDGSKGAWHIVSLSSWSIVPNEPEFHPQ